MTTLLTPQAIGELLDARGIADRYALSPKYVTDKLVKRHDFPAPVVDLTQKLRKWRATDVAAYLGKRQSRAAMSSADSR